MRSVYPTDVVESPSLHNGAVGHQADEPDLNRSLGLGISLGVQVDRAGSISAVLHHGRSFSLTERGIPALALAQAPTVTERLIVPGPGQVSLPRQLRYLFTGRGVRRTIRCDLQSRTVVLEFHHLESPAEVTFDATSPAASFTFALAHDDADAAGGYATVETASAGDSVTFTVRTGSSITISLTSLSPIETAFILASDRELAAVLSSCFHEPDRYLPVFLFPADRPVTVADQFRLDSFRRTAVATHFVFGGLPPEVRESFLWDKPDEFRTRCRAYDNMAQVHADPALAALPELRRPRRALALGLLEARRAGRRLVLDDDAPAPAARRPSGAAIAYESHCAADVVAANLAFYHGAELVESAATQTDVEAVQSAARALEELVATRPTEARTQIEAFREQICEAAGLELSEATSLTAFTTGIPYGAGYDLPTGHVLDAVAEGVILQELLVQHAAAPNPMPVVLFVDTADFGRSELAGRAVAPDASHIAFQLHGTDATKLATLALMHLLPADLQFVVAHGAREVFAVEDWVTGDGEQTIQISTSSRQVSPATADGVDLVRRVSRTVTGTSPWINGIQLSDALLTTDDLRLFGAVPMVSRLVMNNGCATWTSLAESFYRWSGTGYVGTLWPVADRHARKVGRALLDGLGEGTFAQQLHAAVARMPTHARHNYVLSGTAFFAPAPRAVSLAPATRMFTTLMIIESQFQLALTSADEAFLPWLAETVEMLRRPLHEQFLELEPDARPFLLRVAAETTAILRQRGMSADPSAFQLALEALRTVQVPTDERPDIAGYIEECAAGLLDLLLAKGDRDAAVATARMLIDDAQAAGVDVESAIGHAVMSRATGEWNGLQSLLAHAEAAGELPAGAAHLYRKPATPVPIASVTESSWQRNRDASVLHAADELFAEAERLRDSSRLAEARRAYERCLEVYTAHGQPSRAAQVLNNLGILFRISDEPEQALDMFRRSLALKERHGTAGIGNTLMHLADMTAASDATGADDLYGRAEAYFRQRHDQRGLAQVLLQRSRLCHHQGRHEQARELLLECRTAAEAAREWGTLGSAGVRLGMALCHLGDLGHGLQTLLNGLNLLRQIGVPVVEVKEAAVVVRLLDQLRDPGWQPDPHDEAYTGTEDLLGAEVTRQIVAAVAGMWHGRGEASAPAEPGTVVSAAENGDAIADNDRLVSHANALLAAGDVAGARAVYDDVAERYRRNGQDEPWRKARLYNNLGECARAEGRADEAFALYESAIAVLGDGQDPVAVLARINISELAAQTGDFERFERALRQVVSMTAEDGPARGTDRLRWRAGAAFNLAQVVMNSAMAVEALDLLREACRCVLEMDDIAMLVPGSVVVTGWSEIAGLPAEVRDCLRRAGTALAESSKDGAVWAGVAAALLSGQVTEALGMLEYVDDVSTKGMMADLLHTVGTARTEQQP